MFDVWCLPKWCEIIDVEVQRMCEVDEAKMEEKKQEQFFLLAQNKITSVIVRVKPNMGCESLSESGP
jgi:hypothetical protein